VTHLVRVVLPGALAEVAGGQRELSVDTSATTLRGLLDDVAASYPALGRRLRDETGALRRYANVYVDDVDVRPAGGLDAAVAPGATVIVLPSVAGG
jgi:molybdopterin converting factor small subunit